MAWNTPVDRNGEPVAFARSYRVLPRAARAAGETVQVWAPAAGRRLRVRSIHLTTNAATVLTVRLGPNVILEADFAAAGWRDVVFPENGVAGAGGEPLTITTSTAATVGATVLGAEESAS